MKKSREYLETGVNVSLIAVSLLLITLLVKNYFFVVPTSETMKDAAIGEEIFIEGFQWEKGKINVFLFLSSTCQYCTQSAAFYKNLLEETKTDGNIKITAIFLEDDIRANEYLAQIGLGSLEIRKSRFSEIGISGTPTLAIAGDNKVLSDIWKGKLSPKKENEVRQKLGLSTENWSMSESEVFELRKKGQAITVIDVRDREVYRQTHFPDAANIPLDEISVRAINELPLSNTIVVYATFEVESEKAREILIGEGFSKVYVLEYKSQ